MSAWYKIENKYNEKWYSAMIVYKYCYVQNRNISDGNWNNPEKNNSKCKYITILFKTILPGVLLFVKKHNLTPVSQIDVIWFLI